MQVNSKDNHLTSMPKNYRHKKETIPKKKKNIYIYIYIYIYIHKPINKKKMWEGWGEG